MKKLSTQAPLIREAEERELSALQKDWREYFGAKLNKFNAESPADMSEDEKKAFFNDLKKDWERGKGATAAGKKDIEAQGVKEGEEVNEASGFKVGDKVALLSKSDKKKFDAGVVTKVQSDGNVVVNKTQHFNHEIVMDPEFLVKENEEVNEAEVKTDAEFKEYAETVLRKAFGDKYDQKKADETVDGILKKADGDYGAAVGMLTSGLSETDSEEDVYEEFAEIDENLSLSNLGVEGDILYIMINGNKYGYKAPAGKDIEDLAKSFAGMAKHSAGKALSWIKKNAELVFGSKKVTESVNEGLGDFVTDDRFNDLNSLKADIEKKIGPAFNKLLARQGIKYNPVTIKEDRGYYYFVSNPVTGKDIGFFQYGIIEAYITAFSGGKVPKIQEVEGKIQFNPLIGFDLHYSYVHGAQKDKNWNTRGSNGCALYLPGESRSEVYYNILTGTFMTSSEVQKAMGV